MKWDREKDNSKKIELHGMAILISRTIGTEIKIESVAQSAINLLCNNKKSCTPPPGLRLLISTAASLASSEPNNRPTGRSRSKTRLS